MFWLLLRRQGAPNTTKNIRSRFSNRLDVRKNANSTVNLVSDHPVVVFFGGLWNKPYLLLDFAMLPSAAAAAASIFYDDKGRKERNEVLMPPQGSSGKKQAQKMCTGPANVCFFVDGEFASASNSIRWRAKIWALSDDESSSPLQGWAWVYGSHMTTKVLIGVGLVCLNNSFRELLLVLPPRESSSSGSYIESRIRSRSKTCINIILLPRSPAPVGVFFEYTTTSNMAFSSANRVIQ